MSLRLAILPKSHLDPVATAPGSDTLVITDHKIPQQPVQGIMIECVLRSRDTERDMVDAWKGPRVSHPLRKKSYYGGRFVRGAGSLAVGLLTLTQWRAITKRDLHLSRWQWPGAV